MTIDEAFPGLEKTEIPENYLKAALEGTPWFTEDFNYDNGTISRSFSDICLSGGS